MNPILFWPLRGNVKILSLNMDNKDTWSRLKKKAGVLYRYSRLLSHAELEIPRPPWKLQTVLA